MIEAINRVKNAEEEALLIVQKANTDAANIILEAEKEAKTYCEKENISSQRTFKSKTFRKIETS